MTPVRTTIAALSTLAVMATAGHAFAQQAKPRVTVEASAARGDFAAQSNPVALTGRRTLQWDAIKGRWGLKLGVSQPIDREMQGQDVDVGVTYRVKGGLRVGPSVSLAPEAPLNTRKIEPQQPAPRVRLETTFKF